MKSPLDCHLNLETIKNYIYLSTVGLIALGFAYLFIYTTKYGIPFPLELSALPSLLIVTMSVSVLIGMTLLFVLLLPAIAQLNHEKTGYSNIYKEHITSCRNINVFLKTTGWNIFLPMFLFYISAIFPDKNIIKYFLWPSFVYALVRSGFYSWKISKNYKKETTAMVLWINFLSFLWIILVSNFILKSIPPKTPGLYFYIGYPVVLFLLISVNYFLVFPNPQLWKNINKKGIIFCGIFFLFIPILVNPIGQFIVDKSMLILKIGGGYSAIYKFDPKDKDKIFKELVDDNGTNTTKEVSVLLNIGKTKYISSADSQAIYGIDSGLLTNEKITK